MELTPTAAAFLRNAFSTADRDLDGVLSPSEQDELFSTAPSKCAAVCRVQLSSDTQDRVSSLAPDSQDSVSRPQQNRPGGRLAVLSGQIFTLSGRLAVRMPHLPCAYVQLAF